MYRYVFRMPEALRDRVTAFATAENLSFNRALERLVERGIGPVATGIYIEPPVPKKQAEPTRLGEARQKQECDRARFHRKGAYCKFCGAVPA